METGKIYIEDCLETTARMEDGFVDMVITSPPYDGLRTYNGYSFNFEEIAKELYRVVKDGGVVVWVVGDSTVNGSESGTSFRQALYFMEVGFRLHDTMIYKKICGLPLNHNRYEQDYEFMFVFSKGKPTTFNPIIIKTTTNERRNGVFAEHDEKNNKRRSGAKRKDTRPEKIKGNIWEYKTGLYHSTSDKAAFNHPAIFPEQLVADHIHSWSNEGDLVYDPFMGSGTTAKMSHLQKRNWIGSEISAEYVALANKRIKPYLNQIRMF